MKKNPCNECPFRKNSLQGYLGPHKQSSEIIGLLVVGVKFPCHMDVNGIAEHIYEELKDDDIQKLTRAQATDFALKDAPHCTGALQMMNNSCMLSRSREIAEDQKKVGRNDKVFMFQNEFTAYHDDPKFAAIREKAKQRETGTAKPRRKSKRK